MIITRIQTTNKADDHNNRYRGTPNEQNKSSAWRTTPKINNFCLSISWFDITSAHARRPDLIVT